MYIVHIELQWNVYTELQYNECISGMCIKL